MVVMAFLHGHAHSDNNWYLLCSFLFTLAVTFYSWTVYRPGLAKFLAFSQQCSLYSLGESRQLQFPEPKRGWKITTS